MALRDDIFNHPVSWPEVHRDTRRLAREVLAKGPWKGIIALTRGGLVPAAILARELKIFVIDTLCITSYDEQVQGDLAVLKEPERAMAEKGAGWIIVDDLVDTGKTAVKAREMLPEAHIATLYAKPKGLSLVDTYVHDVDQDTWVFFPWDLELQYSRPIVDRDEE